MPIVQLHLNSRLSRAKCQACLHEIAQLVAATLDKPLCDAMVLAHFSQAWLDGSAAPLAFIDFRVISGLTLENSRALCQGMAVILRRYIAIASERIYVNFCETEPAYAWRFVAGQAVCPIAR